VGSHSEEDDPVSIIRASILCVSLAVLASAVWANEGERSLGDAFRDGQPILSFRYRFENVSDDAIDDKDAHASTLRTVIGYRTSAWKGWSLRLEAENVAVVGNDLYNNAGAGDSNNGVRDRPVVADPAGTDINQGFVHFASRRFTLTAGRQEILIGDSRFVGNVGWRQNHQSFDAFRISSTDLGNLKLDYAFIGNVSRINRSNDEMASHLLSGTVDLGSDIQLAVYGLLLDYDDLARASQSSMTFLAELKGATGIGERKLVWEAEYALQSDAGENPADIDGEYLHAMLGTGLARVTAKLGYEVLSGSPEDGQFSTPLATLHKFNGWADKFLSTPVNGLEDLYLSLAGTAGPVGWTVVVHDFGSETGSIDYGQELDVQFLFKTSWGQGIGLKGALYDADELAEDTTKIMVWTEFSR
jgi:hypothetical protein